MVKALAIDLGATSAKCAFFVGEEEKLKFSIDTKDKNVDLLQKIYNEVKIEADKKNINLKEMDFISVAVCGLVDNNTGNVIYSTNLGWKNYPAKNEVKRIFGIEKVVIINDAKAATYGEWIKGMDAKHPSLALYTIGTGIGGGAIFNGELVFGDNTGLPSEPGHGGGFQTEIQCNCGLMGCIEPVSSATGIEKKLNIIAKKSNSELGRLYKQKGSDLTIFDIKDLFANGDKEVRDVFIECLDPLAKSISVLIHFFDISVIVIGGSPSNLGEPLLDIIKEHLRKYCLPDFYKKMNLKLASLTSWVGAWGAYLYGQKLLGI